MAKELQFEGQWIPARVFYLMKTGRITPTDFLLLAIINTMVEHEAINPGSGCWASNPSLARSVNANRRYISERLAYLEKEGFLIRIIMNGVRYLEVEWSRTAEERAAVRGRYGEKLRAAYRGLEDRLAAVSGKPDTSLSGKPDSVLRDSNAIEKECMSRRCADGTKTPDPFCSNSRTPHSRAHRLAVLLREGLQKARKLNPKVAPLAKWEHEMALLLRFVMQEEESQGEGAAFRQVRRVMNWYLQNINEPHQFWAYCAASFREKYAKIKRKMEVDAVRSEERQKANDELYPEFDRNGFRICKGDS